ncbi:MAG: LamG-like jellyroll fold domain-containing protein [Candidatus Paceibacterota bacterium]
MRNISRPNSFTLIELVIVIAVLAILSAVVVITINPAEQMRSARDSTRMSDLQTIHSAIGLYQADGGTSIGSINTVYVSIPDSSATCANLGLPILPTGWSYACSNSTNYRKTDGTGWIPVHFSDISFTNPLSSLPADPINTTSTGNYYTYVTGGSWSLTALFETTKYQDIAIKDGDAYPGVYSIGTNVSLTPGLRDMGLVGYWKFDEGSGTTAYDSSGNGNNGTLTNGPAYTTGKVGSYALSFNGTTQRVGTNREPIPLSNTYNFTWSVWIYPTSVTSGAAIGRQALKDDYLGVNSGAIILTRAQTGAITGGTVIPNQWNYIVGKGDSQKLYVFLNGVQVNSGNHTTPFSATFLNWYAGCLHSSSAYFSGFIDDVRIYNRALSAAEIQAIYNATK